MFRERLKITLKELLQGFLLPMLTFIMMTIVIIWLLVKFPTLMMVAKIAMLVFFALIIILLLSIWVHWQFIEPFKEWRSKK